MWTPVAKLGEFQNGRLVVKRPEHRKPILLLYTGEEVFALEDVCTHDDGPRHGARFDLRTGRQTLPAPRPVKVFPARLEGDTVLLDL